MQILLLCYEYPPIGGGGGVGVQQYAESWAAHGHRIAVLTSRAQGLAARETVGGVDVIRVATVGRKDRATATFLSMFSYLVTGLLYVLLHRRELARFEVLNTHFSIPTGPLGSASAWVLGRPNVLTIIGGDIYDPSKKSSPERSVVTRKLNRWLINGADRVIAISSDTKSRAERLYGVNRPIQVINYGFKPTPSTLDNPPPAEIEPGKFHLISVGRLVSRKGFEYLIRALPRLPDDVVLLLVGDGPLEPVLKEIAAIEHVSGRVVMLGYQTREAIAALLRGADCYVLSSLHEGLGIVVQEAMDAGLPVVATDNGGQVDLIRYPRNGILVNASDSEALARAIADIHSNRELADSMGRNNREDIAAMHIDTNSELYIDIFREVTSECARGPLPETS